MISTKAILYKFIFGSFGGPVFRTFRFPSPETGSDTEQGFQTPKLSRKSNLAYQRKQSRAPFRSENESRPIPEDCQEDRTRANIDLIL